MSNPTLDVRAEGGAKICAALVKAHADIRAIGKDAINPHFKNRYASLDTILETVRPILATHGLAVTQSSEMLMEGKALNVHTVLLHESGEWLGSSAFVPIAKQDAQGAGGALTYGRRYSLSALLALATDEDDDGNAASRAAKPQREARPARSEPAPTAPPARSKALAELYPIDKWTGLAMNRPMTFGTTKGKTLAEHSADELRKLEKWIKEKNDPHFAALLKDVKTVLTDRVLGEPPIESDDKRVEKMVGAVEAETAGLFK